MSYYGDEEEINKWGEDEIIYILTKAQLEYYDELRESDPQNYGMYKGWDERARYNPIKE